MFRFGDVIYYVISKNINSQIIECVGPEVITFKNLIERLLNLLKKNISSIAAIICVNFCKLFQLLPKPLLTEDQLKLLKYDNVLSGKYKAISI